MTEFCFSSTNKEKKKKFCNFTTLYSFIISHPLYFCHLIFFFPYLLRLLSFLCPLFFTTFLLFLCFLTTLIPLHSIVVSKEGFFLAAYRAFFESLRLRFDNEGWKSQPIEEFEVYGVVFDFDVATIEVREENPAENERFGENPFKNEKFKENPVGFSEEKVPQEEEETGCKCENLPMEYETGDLNPKKLKVEEVKKQELISTMRGSNAIEGSKTPNGSCLRLDDGKNFSQAFSQTVGVQEYLGSLESMRREKEWRSTLACKLFEERHDGCNNNNNNNNNNNIDNLNGVGSEEGMDLLWETYETESNRGTKIEDVIRMNDDEDDEDEKGKFCCLQALKMSAGQINLSMGRPNLMKISKAFKGIRWLQSHVRRQGKKGYK